MLLSFFQYFKKSNVYEHICKNVVCFVHFPIMFFFSFWVCSIYPLKMTFSLIVFEIFPAGSSASVTVCNIFKVRPIYFESLILNSMSSMISVSRQIWFQRNLNSSKKVFVDQLGPESVFAKKILKLIQFLFLVAKTLCHLRI